MPQEQIFRWTFTAILVAVMTISSYYRHRARKSGEVIARVREGRTAVILRLSLAAPLFLSLLAYVIHPPWMSWSAISLPLWLRAVACLVGLSLVAFMFWVFNSLGKNVSETVLTKNEHDLVTHGPYRWIRHPLYAGATFTFAALGIIAANWFIITLAVAALIGVAVVVIPKEEAQLIEKFGEQYLAYMSRTNRLFPRIRASQ